MFCLINLEIVCCKPRMIYFSNSLNCSNDGRFLCKQPMFMLNTESALGFADVTEIQYKNGGKTDQIPKWPTMWHYFPSSPSSTQSERRQIKILIFNIEQAPKAGGYQSNWTRFKLKNPPYFVLVTLPPVNFVFWRWLIFPLLVNWVQAWWHRMESLVKWKMCFCSSINWGRHKGDFGVFSWWSLLSKNNNWDIFG